jgi:septum formation protein
LFHGVGSFSIVVIGTYAASANFHQPRDTTMRPFSPQFLGRYLAAAGPQAHQSVGAYQLDGLGIQLFDRIEGDYFAILGLPLLLLCARLRENRILAS